MSEQNQNQDLIDFSDVIVAVKAHFRLFIIVFCLVFIPGIIATVLAKPYYEGKAIIISSIDTGNEISKAIKYLEEIRQNASSDEFIKRTKILPANAAEIKSIEITNETFSNTPEYMQYTAEIRIQSNKADILKPMLLKTVDYLRNNPYLNEKYSEKQAELLDHISRCEKQISSIDSLTQTYQKSQGVSVYMNNIYSDAALINEQILKYNNLLNELHIAQLIDEPYTPSVPAGPKKLLLTAVLVIASFIVALLAVLFKSYKTR